MSDLIYTSNVHIERQASSLLARLRGSQVLEKVSNDIDCASNGSR